ncbi:hypothetical protein [Ancylobacter oerskovii]|uniref:Uncharacterized protein n=1 Tax=Ancylobacter oerskovii TaxID=459519 RepID=A0ABW4YUB9_9HYPH|nr:hypothetical protein [Ancylobacter oerskovii]MBS7544639.1 hypothetical protein [Ancylobacter oerskovii]
MSGLYWLDDGHGEGELEGSSSLPPGMLRGLVGEDGTLPEMTGKSENLLDQDRPRDTPRAPCAVMARAGDARLSDRRGRLEKPRGSSDDAEARKSWAWAPDLKPGDTVRPGILSRFSALPSASDPPGITGAAFRRMAAPVFALVREARELYRWGRHKQARNRMMVAEQHTAQLLGEEEPSSAELRAAVTSAQSRMYRVAGDAEEALERVLRNAWLYDWTNPERCIRRLRALHFPDRMSIPDQLTPVEWDLVRAGNPLMIVLAYPVIAGTIRAQMDGKFGQPTMNAKWGQNPLPSP